MTPELFQQVIDGIIPNDDDLLKALNWFKSLQDNLIYFRPRYDIVVDDLQYHVKALEGFVRARRENEKSKG